MKMTIALIAPELVNQKAVTHEHVHEYRAYVENFTESKLQMITLIVLFQLIEILSND